MIINYNINWSLEDKKLFFFNLLKEYDDYYSDPNPNDFKDMLECASYENSVLKLLLKSASDGDEKSIRDLEGRFNLIKEDK